MPQPDRPGPITSPTPPDTTATPEVRHTPDEAQPDDVAVLVTSDPPAPVPDAQREERGPDAPDRAPAKR